MLIKSLRSLDTQVIFNRNLTKRLAALLDILQNVTNIQRMRMGKMFILCRIAMVEKVKVIFQTHLLCMSILSICCNNVSELDISVRKYKHVCHLRPVPSLIHESPHDLNVSFVRNNSLDAS